MTESHINYPRIIQKSALFIVREALKEAQENRLWEMEEVNYFTIALNVNVAGVKIPAHLKKSHPDELTIVLQHKYWDLQVSDDEFSVKVSFSGKIETLVIPFSSLLSFADPHTGFAVKFYGENEISDVMDEDEFEDEDNEDDLDDDFEDLDLEDTVSLKELFPELYRTPPPRASKTTSHKSQDSDDEKKPSSASSKKDKDNDDGIINFDDFRKKKK